LTDLYDVEISRLDGKPLDLAAFRGDALLIVNVASACGLTPQYEALQQLYERYSGRGLSVIGVPCNQFGEQEPGNSEEIAGFCSQNYSVTFPMTEKVDVNGVRRHPLYLELTQAADADGRAGDVQWNFEKFLVSPQGHVVARFRPLVAPDADDVVQAIETILPR